MELQRTYYQVLGIPPNATQRQVIRRYRQLVRTFHPDIASGDKAVAAQVFLQINVAYRTLRHTERRALYDEQLFGPPPARPPLCEGKPGSEASPAPKANVPKNCMTIPDAVAAAHSAYKLKRAAEAEELCRRIVSVEPKNAEAHRLWGDILSDQRNHRDALFHYAAAAEAGDKSLQLEEKIRGLKLAGNSKAVLSAALGRKK